MKEEKAMKNAPLRSVPKTDLKGKPSKPDKKDESEVCPVYDYNKVLGSNKDGNYKIGGIKLLGDDFTKYDEPENNFKLANLIKASGWVFCSFCFLIV